MDSNHRSAALLLSAVRPPSKTTSTNSEALPSNARRYARNCYWPKSAPSVRCWPHSTTTQDSLVVGTREQVWWDDDVELYFDPDSDQLRSRCRSQGSSGDSIWSVSIVVPTATIPTNLMNSACCCSSREPRLPKHPDGKFGRVL